MRKLILINLQHQLVQCGTVQYNAQEQTQKIEICISTYNPPLLMTRSSSRARQPLSRVNLTGFPFLNSDKNRKYLSISIKNLKISRTPMGDSAYPISPWLPKPFPEATRDRSETQFNCELSSARVKIACAFGCLKSRWRILQKRLDTTLPYDVPFQSIFKQP